MLFIQDLSQCLLSYEGSFKMLESNDFKKLRRKLIVKELNNTLTLTVKIVQPSSFTSENFEFRK